MTTRKRRPAEKAKVRAVRPQIGKYRMLTVGFVGVAVLGLFMWRLVDLQLSPDPQLARGLGTRIVERPLPAPRGEIVDRYGRPLALSLPAPTIIAEPRLVSVNSVPAVVDKLQPLLSASPDTLTRRLSGDGYFAYMDRQVDAAVGEAIAELSIPGVSIIEEPRREHPNGECSGISVIGRVNVDHDGISGLEEQYDESLTGTDGRVMSESSANGRNTIPGGRQIVDPAQPGSDLVLTLDRNIQFEAEKVLAEAVEQTGGELGTIIVTIPESGEIVAMANVRRDVTTGLVGCTTTNLAAIWTYEPGSVMKPITVSSLLENDPTSVHRSIEVPYSITRDDGDAGKVFRDYWVHDTEEMSLADIISKSSNVGAILIAEEVGDDALYETLVTSGFGSSTSLGFKGEASGILDRLDIHSLKLANVAIGQGIAVTPLQMITAYNAFANGGMAPSPVLLADAVGSTPARQTMTPATASNVMAMMREVVEDGTGTRAAIPGYDVVGKTGTAWQPCSVEFGYECEGGGRHYTATFVGVVGNDDGPALSVIVVVDDPQKELGDYAGGSVAAPVFKNIAAYALRQLRVAPRADADGPQERVRSLPATEPIVPTTTEVPS